MHKIAKHYFRAAPLAMAAALAGGGLLMAGCGGDDANELNTLVGESQQVSGGTVSTWAQTDGNAQVVTAGVTLPLVTIQTINTTNLGPVAVLSMPQAVQDTTFINHMQLNWNEQGHPPAGVYTHPHFDIHFYNQTATQVATIDCSDTTPTAADRIPAGYQLPPPTAPGACVPRMGFHAGPGSNFQPGYHFMQTMILGYYGGRLTFVEPMVTRERLLQKQTFTLDIPAPQVVGVSTRYPTKLTAEWDEHEQAYHFTLHDFVNVQ